MAVDLFVVVEIGGFFCQGIEISQTTAKGAEPDDMFVGGVGAYTKHTVVGEYFSLGAEVVEGFDMGFRLVKVVYFDEAHIVRDPKGAITGFDDMSADEL